MSQDNLGDRIARQDALEETLHARLIELLSAFKDDYSATYDHPCSAGNISLAAALLPAIEECVDDEFGLDYLADMLHCTVEEVRSAPDGFVYILKAGEFYKIGRARKLTPRIKTLKIQLPFEAKIWHAFPCEDHIEAERQLHEHFERHRVNGEWFRLPDIAIEGWLRECQYMADPRGEYSAIGKNRADYHDRIPAALLADKQWGRAFTEAWAAREECE